MEKKNRKHERKKKIKRGSSEPTTLIFSSLSDIQGKMAPRMSA